MPRVYLIEGARNAFACVPGHPSIAVSRMLVQEFSRTELEAVVAACLERLSSGAARAAARAAAFGTGGGWIGVADDVRTCAITRYPPALSAALSKCEPYRGRFAPFYLVAEHPSHQPVAQRVAALAEP